jgi:hypothetical protein
LKLRVAGLHKGLGLFALRRARGVQFLINSIGPSKYVLRRGTDKYYRRAMRTPQIGLPLDVPTQRVIDNLAWARRTSSTTLIREWVKAGLAATAAANPDEFAKANDQNVPLDQMCSVGKPGRPKKEES